MLTRTHRPRTGFTLIELLVVMGIIATMIALLLPALGGARASALRTQNTDRMGKIATALTNLKEPQAGLNLDSIPSHPINTTVLPGTTTVPAGFALKSVYAGNEPELFYLKKAWPNMNTAANPGPGNDTSNGYAGPDIVMDANQTLVFFLTGGAATNGSGFSHNPRRPFNPPSSGEKRKGPFLEFNAGYILAGPTLNNQLAPWVIDPYGTPYAYFAAVNGRPGAYGGQTFTLPPASFRVPPTPVPVTPLMSGGKYVKENSFQIISAGRDKVFGAGGPMPTIGNPGGEDDQGHFQPTLLGSK